MATILGMLGIVGTSAAAGAGGAAAGAAAGAGAAAAGGIGAGTAAGIAGGAAGAGLGLAAGLSGGSGGGGSGPASLPVPLWQTPGGSGSNAPLPGIATPLPEPPGAGASIPGPGSPAGPAVYSQGAQPIGDLPPTAGAENPGTVQQIMNALNSPEGKMAQSALKGGNQGGQQQPAPTPRLTFPVPGSPGAPHPVSLGIGPASAPVIQAALAGNPIALRLLHLA